MGIFVCFWDTYFMLVRDMPHRTSKLQELLSVTYYMPGTVVHTENNICVRLVSKQKE